jgi:type I restriction enzyme R subunit
MTEPGGLTPEQRARLVIDKNLELAGWIIQNRDHINLGAGQGIAVREVPMGDGGYADYLLYVNSKIVGVIEAKKDGVTLAEVHEQALRYAKNLTDRQQVNATTTNNTLPFVYEATSQEMYFTNHYDPQPRQRRIFNIQRPEALAGILRDAVQNPGEGTWRGRVQSIPSTDAYDLRPASRRSVIAIEESLKVDSHSKSLVQMATGAGKTRMAVTEAYRLLKFGGFKRVLFLVDRNNLGDQTIREFRDWTTPDDGRKFTELYNVDKLTAAGLTDSSKVVVSTIQRLWAGIKGDPIPEDDDEQLDGYQPEQVVTAMYSPDLPPEAFDLIIVDECHRSIYGLWRQVLEYFDAHIIGLTATPTKQTLGFFEQNLVSEYTYAESVADGVNVDFDVYRIRTEVSEQGGAIEAGELVKAIDKRTREEKIEQLEEELQYKPTELDRAVTNPNQIRLVIETFRDRLFTEIFPGRTEVPKTLIFAKSDSHAEDIVLMSRQVFGRGNDFAQKITYTAKNAKDLLQKFRNSPDLRIAVTVDMIATGTDVKPLECVFFMRDIRSGTYFEQMKGRGARSIDDATFQTVTPDATHKEKFVIVDAVGVTEHEFVDVTVIDRVKTIPLEKLLERAANHELTQDEAATLAARLARLNRRLTPSEADELDALSGSSLEEITTALVRVTDAEALAEAIAAAPTNPDGTKDEAQAIRDFVQQVAAPIANNPEFRQRILSIHKSHYLYRDEITPDVLIGAGGVPNLDKAREYVTSWKQYLEDNKDEIVAIQMLYSTPQGAQVSYDELRRLIDTIRLPHPEWTPEVIWKAYQLLNKTDKAIQNQVADLVSLVRYTLGVMPELEPFADVVEQRYESWLLTQQQHGAQFTPEQQWWLDNIKNAICTGVSFSVEQLDVNPFTDHGGSMGFSQSFTNPVELLSELNQELSA